MSTPKDHPLIADNPRCLTDMDEWPLVVEHYEAGDLWGVIYFRRKGHDHMAISPLGIIYKGKYRACVQVKNDKGTKLFYPSPGWVFV